jgi:DNA polymerase III gamma/tau subunit
MNIYCIFLLIKLTENGHVIVQIGVVSDDELLGLLDLALSSDTSSTVIRARELMRSRIDPMQLVSQLANLIMDVLAGKCKDDSSEVRRKFSRKHSCKSCIFKYVSCLALEITVIVSNIYMNALLMVP